MGRVYKANDIDIKEKIALKLIKPEIATDKKTIERFQNELKLARKIRHKNICQMYDLNREKGTYYLTMEYVEGENLGNMIRMSGQLGTATAISIASQVCDGLAEAHKLGVVHRDLKPSNIMIDREGSVRIMDFGIARSLKEKSITGAGVMIGTPEYMSPEQVEGKEVDQRADLYSLGVILFEMTTGRVPFEGDTPFTVGVKQKSEAPRDPREINSQVSEDISNVILKCMEKVRENRYQSASEVLAELGRINEGIQTTEKVVPKKRPLTSKEITVKFNVKRALIPAFIVLALAITAILVWRLVVPTTSIKNSVAVLPFEDLSPGKDQEHMATGIPETLINALSRIEGLKVPGRISSFSLRDEQDIQNIGDRLGVDTLLEGSIQTSGNNLRIMVRLINIDDGFQIWAQEYQRTMDDIFSIQDDIAQSIVKALKVKFIGEREGHLINPTTENREAYNNYLRGRHFWNLRSKEGLNNAVKFFEKAIELDQNYALAYVGLADCYVLLPWYGGWLPKNAYPQARAFALRALEIDNLLAEAHVSLAAVYYWFDWDWQSAEKEFKLALELNPGYATGHHWYGSFLGDIGRVEESIAEQKKALELDPLSLIINQNLADYLYVARRYDDAMEQYKRAIEIDPDFIPIQDWIGRAYLVKGMYEEAIKKFEISGHPLLTIAYTALGKKDEALKVLEELKIKSTIENIDPTYLAIAYLGVGQKDLMFEYLEKAYQERYPNLLDFTKDPLIHDLLQSEPRYKAFLTKMDLGHIFKTGNKPE
jgi:serine/threonine-protein kinase